MMKKLIIFPVILIALSFTMQVNAIPDEIVSAFRSGSATTLSNYINKTVELTVDDKEEIYSKAQAEVILKDFFARHKPTSFNILHQAIKPLLNMLSVIWKQVQAATGSHFY